MSQTTTEADPANAALVADIGGTNARFASFDQARNQWLGEWTGAVSDYPDLYTAVAAAVSKLDPAGKIQRVCIGIAAPVYADWVAVSNSDWAFSQAALRQRFGWTQLIVMNDFLAAAYGVISLSPGQYTAIGKSSLKNVSLPSALIGPGTGLGVAGLFPDERAATGGAWYAVGTEGGHARFAPVDSEEIALLEVLGRQLGCVQREDILSGRGLCNLHGAFAQVHGISVPEVTDPAFISSQALVDGNSISARVLERFCGILGTVAADVALDLGTRGTVFLAGGILPRVADFLLASRFRERFENHPRFGHYLQSIDTVLVTEKNLGLIGATYRLRSC